MCVMWDERACSAKCEGAGNYRGAVLFFKGRERIAVGVRGRGCGLGSPLFTPSGQCNDNDDNHDKRIYKHKHVLQTGSCICVCVLVS